MTKGKKTRRNTKNRRNQKRKTRKYNMKGGTGEEEGSDILLSSSIDSDQIFEEEPTIPETPVSTDEYDVSSKNSTPEFDEASTENTGQQPVDEETLSPKGDDVGTKSIPERTTETESADLSIIPEEENETSPIHDTDHTEGRVDSTPQDQTPILEPAPAPRQPKKKIMLPPYIEASFIASYLFNDKINPEKKDQIKKDVQSILSCFKDSEQSIDTIYYSLQGDEIKGSIQTIGFFLANRQQARTGDTGSDQHDSIYEFNINPVETPILKVNSIIYNFLDIIKDSSKITQEQEPSQDYKSRIYQSLINYLLDLIDIKKNELKENITVQNNKNNYLRKLEYSDNHVLVAYDSEISEFTKGTESSKSEEIPPPPDSTPPSTLEEESPTPSPPQEPIPPQGKHIQKIYGGNYTYGKPLISENDCYDLFLPTVPSQPPKTITEETETGRPTTTRLTTEKLVPFKQSYSIKKMDDFNENDRFLVRPTSEIIDEDETEAEYSLDDSESESESESDDETEEAEEEKEEVADKTSQSKEETRPPILKQDTATTTKKEPQKEEKPKTQEPIKKQKEEDRVIMLKIKVPPSSTTNYKDPRGNDTSSVLKEVATTIGKSNQESKEEEKENPDSDSDSDSDSSLIIDSDDSDSESEE